MKTMLREHKGKLIVSSLIILLPMVTNSLWWGTWFWPPLLMLILQWAGVFITFYDQKNRNQSRKAMGLVIWLVPVISLFTGALAATVHMGAQAVSVVTLLTFFSMGLIFVLCGNYMPKFRQNRTIGIKIKWALEDEENWNATHRFSGKVWVIGGLLCMACALIPDPAFAFIPFLLIVVIVAILPCGYSYWFYRQQLKNGVIQKTPLRPRTVVSTLVIILAIVGFFGWTLFTGSMEIQYGDTSFTMETANWEDLTIAYQDIDTIEYQERDPSEDVSDLRTNGFGNFTMALGSFQNELYGNYTRYTYASCKACVKLVVNGKTVVINGPDEESTKEIYTTLQEKMASIS